MFGADSFDQLYDEIAVLPYGILGFDRFRKGGDSARFLPLGRGKLWPDFRGQVPLANVRGKFPLLMCPPPLRGRGPLVDTYPR